MINIWPNIQFIIIDELSMVGCSSLTTIHLKPQKLKSNIVPFGAINIMFMGDILYIFPINDTPLYSTNIQLIFKFTKLKQKNHKAFGKIKFNQIILF
jgi:hypothetical protein